MTSANGRRLTAVMIIAMLAVAEGARVQANARFSQADQARSDSGKSYREGRRAEMLETQSGDALDLHGLFQDPAYQRQMEVMAEKMDEFAAKMKSTPGLRAAANEMARELSGLTEDPKAIAASMLPEQMEAMIGNRYFQEHAQALAEGMETVLEANVDFQDQLEAVKTAASAQHSSAQVSKKMMDDMTTPDFQRVAERVSGALDTLMSDSTLQQEAFAAAEYIEQMKGSADPNILAERVEAMLGDSRLQKRASDVVAELFSSDLPGEVEEMKKAVQMSSPSPFKTQSPMTAFHLPVGGASKAPAQRLGLPTMHHDGLGQHHEPLAAETAQVAKIEENALTSAKGIRSMLPSMLKALPRRLRATGSAMAEANSGPVDFVLLACLTFWYLGNYYYNIGNKIALNVAGGANGFPLAVSTIQLGVGVIYALFLWVAPDARTKPTITFKDFVGTLPLSAAAAGAHAATTFSLGAGSVSFAQIVKAAEPAFAALIGTAFYGVKVSTAKWLSLIPVIGGVTLASLGEMNFALSALITAALANVFAAIKGNENKKLMESPGVNDRLGSVGNQFAITVINMFWMCGLLTLALEGPRLGELMTIAKTQPAFMSNVVQSGAWWYIYNELATLVIKRAGAVAGSVANTAKRVIIIVGVALVMKESLGPLKLIGSAIGIGGVFVYSIADKIAAKLKSKKAE